MERTTNIEPIHNLPHLHEHNLAVMQFPPYPVLQGLVEGVRVEEGADLGGQVQVLPVRVRGLEPGQRGEGQGVGLVAQLGVDVLGEQGFGVGVDFLALPYEELLVDVEIHGLNRIHDGIFVLAVGCQHVVLRFAATNNDNIQNIDSNGADFLAVEGLVTSDVHILRECGLGNQVGEACGQGC